ncbi:pre-mRNA splicing factor (Prp31), putative [Talaromyces stipitatus ATCC 10500]|uniref:Pre-mRNA splicing factor (Prp31), putative n=1 Tax=Talaromyces stipitatus (strain ATCC 10500 / CBS 375.48 / QM 6759 / NRRL 1006) TaxID=441959 RepID=B8LW41_TALSN|nr:pre-mRNA splicing factor (Prp31), putative [Talaromyces stipitatus ATCC 10500]EED24069.1 pre-mRNA splicing factor (Prp31), putative [Talaromyces stipitatus ATCC 10500]
MSAAEDLLRDFEDSDVEDLEENGAENEGQEMEIVPETTEQESVAVKNDFEVAMSAADELARLHKFLRDHYSVRFPELETLITNPINYAKTVAILGNGPLDNIKQLSTSSDNIVGAPLNTVLDGPSLMVVTVEGTSTRGREMSEAELKLVLDTCQNILKLDRERTARIESVQSRMTEIAPNLTALIGSQTAAQFLNQAGGLLELAKIPACNLAAQGSKKQEGLGFATNVGIRQQGFLYHSPIIQDIPNDVKRQAMRIVAAKMVLAARADVARSSPDGSMGEELKQQCFHRLDKLTEPPPNKGPRALPAPDDKPARKRGGRRARKAKEAVAMTEIRKAQNRVAFGREEQEAGYGTGDGTVGLGMLGQENDGRIRAAQIDQRTRARLSKSNKGWGAATPISGIASSLRAPGNATVLQAKGLRTSGVGTSINAAGTASSIAFTPVQGLELVDPKVQAELNRKRKAEEDRWFKSGTFTQVGSQNGQGANGGFKVPDVPASKKVNTGDGNMAPPPVPLRK